MPSNLTQLDHAKQTPATVTTGIARLLFLLLGLLSLGLAYLGWLLPGLPCSPFVLLASYFFSRSSPRLQRWLLSNKLFGSYLRDIHEHRGIRQHMKVKATCLIAIVVSCSVASLIYLEKPWYLWAFIPPLALLGLTIMWFVVKTLPNESQRLTDN